MKLKKNNEIMTHLTACLLCLAFCRDLLLNSKGVEIKNTEFSTAFTRWSQCTIYFELIEVDSSFMSAFKLCMITRSQVSIAPFSETVCKSFVRLDPGPRREIPGPWTHRQRLGILLCRTSNVSFGLNGGDLENQKDLHSNLTSFSTRFRV